MSTLEWNRPQDRTYESGLDRGVLYLESGEAIPWSGLVSVDDAGTAETKEFYMDGIKFLATVSGRDWAGKIEAYTYPDEFAALLGIAEVEDGLYLDSQMGDRFGLSYRTIVTSPDYDQQPHYKIHLIYKAMAAIQEFSHQTLSSSTDPNPFEFEISAIPQWIPNRRPSAHVIIDTRKLDVNSREAIENLIYGTSTTDPVLPSVLDLAEIMSFGDRVVVVYNGDQTWTATGSNDDIVVTQSGYFTIKNVDAEYIDEDTYRFLYLDGVISFMLTTDTDGVPYYSLGYGGTNLNIDTDGVPYFLANFGNVVMEEDTDGVPYFI